MERYDVVIIGRGPAGISAALYTVRAGLSTAILYSGDGALEKAHKIDNYYGFPGGVSGQELLEGGMEQAKGLGVSFLNVQVTGILPMKEVLLQTTTGQIEAGAVILATGKAKLRPAGLEVARLEGKGVSYCAVCDGFFYRGKNVCVIGAGDYALSEANELKPLATVTILTNGETPSFGETEIPVLTGKIAALEGETSVTGIQFGDGSRMDTNGVFVAIGTASAAALARKTGIALDGDNIRVDDKMQTNVKGVFAAGDCVGGFLQVSKAVADGAMAGKNVIAYLREEK